MSNDEHENNVIDFNKVQKQVQENTIVINEEQEKEAVSNPIANGEGSSAVSLEQGASQDSAQSDEIDDSNREQTNDDIDNSDPRSNPMFLPEPLKKFRSGQLFAGFLLALIGGIGAVAFKSPGPLILLIGTAYYAANALLVRKKYHSGRIIESTAICSGIRPATVKERVLITFREEHEDGSFSYHKFYVPGKNKADEFIVNAPYIIYYDLANPNALLGSIVI